MEEQNPGKINKCLLENQRYHGHGDDWGFAMGVLRHKFRFPRGIMLKLRFISDFLDSIMS